MKILQYLFSSHTWPFLWQVGKLFAITQITDFLYFKRYSPYDAAKTLYMQPRGYNSWSDGANHGDTLSPTKNQGHKMMGGALLEGGICWVFYGNWQLTFPVRSFLLRHNLYTLRRNSSLHCISLSQWALSCLCIAWLMIYSEVSCLFWEYRLHFLQKFPFTA